MSRPLVVLGAGQVAEVFGDYLTRSGMRPDAYAVDAKFLEPVQRIDDVPVVAFENLSQSFPDARFLVGWSFKGLNKPRAERFEAMLGKLSPVTYRHNMCGVSPSVRLGPGCFIMDLNILQRGVEVGMNCVFFPHNHVGHHTKIGNHVWLSSGIVVSGGCEIGDYTFIGSGATIADGVKIGKSCIIGAGATITSDCEDFGVYPGPAAVRSKVPSYKLKGVWAQ